MFKGKGSLLKKAISYGLAGLMVFASTGACPVEDSGRALIGDGPMGIGYNNPIEEISISQGSSIGNAKAKDTLMIYMVGSNLESENGCASWDLAEMIQSDYNRDDINVVVFTGGCSQWKIDISSDKNYVMRLADGDGVYMDGETDQLYNMGDPETLLGFLNFCKENYNSENYGLILWDHGAGPVYGYGADEIYKNDLLTYEEMSQAMASSAFGNKGLSFVGFDACLMASVEYAKLFEPYTDYLIASQEVEPGMGWDYSFLGNVNGLSDGEAFAKNVIDSYQNYYETNASVFANPLYTMSCLDLRKAKDLIGAADKFFGDMYNELGNDRYNEIVKARDDALNLGAAAYGSKGDSIDLIDIGSLAYNFGDICSSSEALSKSLEEMVVYQCSNVEGTSGLSIYYPYNNQMFYDYYGQNVIEDISICDNYTKFIDAFSYAWDVNGQDLSSVFDFDQDQPDVETTEASTEATEASTEATEASTEATEASTEATTEASTEATEASTEATEASTEATEASTETTTEASTEATTEATTEAVTEAASEETSEETTEDVSDPGLPATMFTPHTGLTFNPDFINFKLNEEQLYNTSSVSYSILYRNESSYYYDAFAPILWNISIEPDSNGNVKIPMNPRLIVAKTLGEECIWPFKEVSKQGSTRTYKSMGQYLIASMADFPNCTTESVTVTLSIEGNGEPKIIGFDAESATEIAGKSTVDASKWSYMGYYSPTYLPTKDENGNMLPFSTSDRDNSMYFHYSELGDNFNFVSKRLSELEGEFVCQVVITDIAGNKHASNYVDITRKPRIYSEIETENGKMRFKTFLDHSELVAYEGSDSVVEVPDEVEGKPVTIIGYGVFSNTDIKEVKLPKTIEGLGQDAFAYCREMESIELPEGLKEIGASCFSSCEKLSGVELPGSLEAIGTFAFSYCKNLGQIKLPKNLTYYGMSAISAENGIDVGGGMTNFQYINDCLYNKTGTKLIQCFSKESDYVIPDGVEKIGDHSFRNNDFIENLTIPESVKEIGNGAFYGMENLKSFNVPDSVEEIGDSAFGNFNLDEDKDMESVKLGPNIKTIGKNAFSAFKVKNFEVDENNKYFSTKEGFLTNKAGDGLILAPYMESGEVVIPEGIISVYAEDAFSINREADRLVLSDSVKILNGQALTYMTELYIGAGLNSFIDTQYVSNLTNIEISDQNTNYKVVDNVLYTGDMKELLIYPQASSAEEYIVPEGVEKISEEALGSAYNLKKISLPSTLASLGTDYSISTGNGVSGIPFLEEVTVSEDNPKFSSVGGVLYSKDQKTLLAVPANLPGKIEILDGVELIEKSAIYAINSADEVVLPDSLTRIEYGNFVSFIRETRVDIYAPENLTYISSGSFGTACRGYVVLHGKKGSYIEEFAGLKGLRFVEE
ncbi:MAG: leucine-rich repeat protein [Eubacterium sp.]|nr:leucine-rich repeat protein [Eubacterium sp.]